MKELKDLSARQQMLLDRLAAEGPTELRESTDKDTVAARIPLEEAGLMTSTPLKPGYRIYEITEAGRLKADVLGWEHRFRGMKGGGRR
jgi:hypothetical protein